MFAASADGIIFPPYVMYKATNMYDTWTLEGPAKCMNFVLLMVL